VDINQIYRAPAVPKLSKRNISSSVLRASSAISSTSPVTPKLRTTRFSFRSPINLSEKLEALKPKPLDAEKVLSKKQDTEENTYKALAETNRILVEIQKQLSLDFAMRIVEEKEAVKKIKSAESKRKVAEKEKSVEGVGKKIAGVGQSIAERVTAPIKSVFDKIKEFFSLILSGIVLNVAFKWLQDENNRKLLDQIFYWIGKAFVPAVITIIGFKVFKWVRRLFLLGRFLWKLPGRLFNIFQKKPPEGPKPSVPKPISGPSVSRTNQSFARFIEGKSNIGDRFRLLRKGLIDPTGMLTKGGFTPEGTLKGTGGFKLPSLPKISPGSLLRGGATLGIGIGLEMLGKFAIKKVTDPLMEKTRKDTINRINSYDPNKRSKTIERIQSDLEKEKNYQSSPQHSLEKIINLGSATQSEVKMDFLLSLLKDLGETPRFASGGTVPGKGSGFVDSVKAMLAPGEEVIRTTSSMLFRPLLKDINDNAGRLWVLFTQAIRKLFTVSDYQRDVSEEFSKVIKDFDKYLKEEILKKKTKPTKPGGGGMRSPSISPKTSAPSPSVSAAPRITNISMNVSAGSGGGMTFLPMVLPKQSSKPPQIPQMQGKATDVPVISPVNFANPYMEVTPGLYGIQLIG
jgi:hypothetical protein